METSPENCNAGTSASSTTTEEPKAPLNAYACAIMNQDIPFFWTDAPRLWFIKFEAFMHLQNQMNDDRYKYNIAITKLKMEAVEAIGDIIMNPPDTGKYDALKNRLLYEFEESREKRMTRILNEIRSGKIPMLKSFEELNELLK